MKKTTLTKKEDLAIQKFFEEKNLPCGVALTFDDVTLPEEFSDIRSRGDITDFSTELIPGKITLNIPFISANMESVTGADMSIALEREGGLGIIPQTLPLEEKLHILERVKRSNCALIEEPLTTRPHTPLDRAKKTMEKFNVKSLIVVDKDGKPVGVLSKRDWFYEENEEILVSKLMTKKPITASVNTNFETAKRILRKHNIEKLPLVDKNGTLAGLITAHGLFFKKHHPRALRNNQGQFMRIGSIGVKKQFTEQNLKEVEAQVKLDIEALLIDTARPFAINTKEAIVHIKKEFPELPLIAGNVSTPEGTKFLLELGVDVVKIGQGPGDVCTTRAVGIGIPQLTAIALCSTIAKQYGKTTIADGGIRNPSDIAKAIIAGASSVMIGFLFAGTYESAALAYSHHSKEFGTDITVKDYIGAASFEAQLRRLERNELDHIRRPEGVKRTIPVVGSLSTRIDDLLGGLRSAMSYLGAKTIKEFSKKGRFVLQTNAGVVEGIGKK